MPQAFVAAPLLLAAVLILAAVSKWKARESLVGSMQLLRLPAWLHPTAKILPEVEVALAVALLVIPWSLGYVVVAAAVLGLMLAYVGIIARGLTMTPRPSCGCFGRIGAPIKPETLVRNIVFATLALLGLLWGLAGNSVPSTLLTGGVGLWAWLLMLVAAVVVTRWIVLERSPRFPVHQPAPVPAPEPTAVAHPDDLDDYVREPIPAYMLLDGDTPVSLTRLASVRAVLLIWVTCGCGRSHDGLAKAKEWRETMPLIDVRVVSTLTPEATQATFPDQTDWLYDLDGQVLRALNIYSDPAAILLGADGWLAGGPVAGLDEVIDFGEEIREQLAEAIAEQGGADAPEAPEPSEAPALDGHADDGGQEPAGPVETTVAPHPHG